ARGAPPPPPPPPAVRAILAQLADLPAEAEAEERGLAAAQARIVALERELDEGRSDPPSAQDLYDRARAEVEADTRELLSGAIDERRQELLRAIENARGQWN